MPRLLLLSELRVHIHTQRQTREWALTYQLLHWLRGTVTHAHVHMSVHWHEMCAHTRTLTLVCSHLCCCCLEQLCMHALHTSLHMCAYPGASTHTCMHTQRHLMCMHSLLQLLFLATTCMYTNRCARADRVHVGAHTCTLGKFFTKTTSMSPPPASMSLLVSPHDGIGPRLVT